MMTSQDLRALPQPPADRTIAYGLAPQQVAELRLPKANGPHPVVIVLHGGCWQAPWGFDHVRSLAEAAKEHRLDLDRVVALGHSAGGQLALWLAARPRLPESSPLRAARPLPLRGVVSLAGITDLRAGATAGVCGARDPIVPIDQARSYAAAAKKGRRRGARPPGTPPRPALIARTARAGGRRLVLA